MNKVVHKRFTHRKVSKIEIYFIFIDESDRIINCLESRFIGNYPKAAYITIQVKFRINNPFISVRSVVNYDLVVLQCAILKKSPQSCIFHLC